MSVLIFIVVLVLLIVGHEFGHFIVAKLLKMRVLEFGVGFPPKIFGKKVGDTEYTLNWIPFGGFVRIFGEDAKEAEDPIAFPNRPKFHQALVLFAGPFANIVIGFVLLALALMFGTASLIDEGTKGVTDARVLVAEVLPDSPADLAGIKTGEYIKAIEINNLRTEIKTPEELSEIVRDVETGTSANLILYDKGDTEKIVPITPKAGLIESDLEIKALGVATALVGTVSYPPHIAIYKAFIKTWQNLALIVVSLVTLLGSAVTLSADFSQIAGPVGIAGLTGQAASIGFGALLSFSALLSINLAVINLFPFPALDGGRLLFLGVEAVTRRKIPLKTAQLVNFGGFAILILLMVAVTVGDISRLFG